MDQRATVSSWSRQKEPIPLAGILTARGKREKDPANFVVQSTLLIAEFSDGLQAVEVIQKGRIERATARQTNHIEEGIRGDSAAARIGDRGANEPDCSSVRPSHVLLAFSRASRLWRVLT